MARTNPFAKIMEQADPQGENPVALDYTVKGASRSLINTIDEMAAQADKLLKGETIIEIDCQRRSKSRPLGGAKVGHLALRVGNVGRA